MADPRSPTEIANFATQFEAEAVAEVVRSEGIEAAVFGGGAAMGGVLGGFGVWSVLVPSEHADRARQVIIASREARNAAPTLRVCVACGYSLEGLESAERCPECGQDLESVRLDARVRGLTEHEERTVPAGGAAWRWLLVGLGVCALLGVGVIVIEDFGLAARTWWMPLPIGLVVLVLCYAAASARRRKGRRARGAKSD